MAVQYLKYGYDSRANGLRLVASGENASFVTYIPKQTQSNGDYTGGSKGVSIGTQVTLTGIYMYFSHDSFLYYYTKNGSAVILLDNSNGYMWDDWKSNGYGDKSPTYSKAQAQALVDKILQNNQIIICNNLICARFANKLSASERQSVKDLQNRIQSRNTQLINDGVLENIKTSYPSGFSNLSSYLEKLMNSEAVGVAAWVVIVIAATVIASLSTAAYFAYKNLALESERDVKFSKQLTATLTQKLTPEEYQQLLNETKGIATKSRIAQLISSNAGWIGWAVALTGGYIAYRVLKNRKVL